MKQKLRRPRNQKRGPEGPFRFFPPETTPVLFRCEYPKFRRTIIFTDILEIVQVLEGYHIQVVSTIYLRFKQTHLIDGVTMISIFMYKWI